MLDSRLKGRVLPALLACVLLAAPGAGSRGQVPEEGAVTVGQRFDPLTNTYRTVVIPPLAAGAIRAIQTVLRNEGYERVRLSAELDRETRAALRGFQTARGLRITGYPDYATVRELGVPVRSVPGGTIPGASRAQRRAATVIAIGRKLGS